MAPCLALVQSYHHRPAWQSGDLTLTYGLTSRLDLITANLPDYLDSWLNLATISASAPLTSQRYYGTDRQAPARSRAIPLSSQLLAP